MSDDIFFTEEEPTYYDKSKVKRVKRNEMRKPITITRDCPSCLLRAAADHTFCVYCGACLPPAYTYEHLPQNFSQHSLEGDDFDDANLAIITIVSFMIPLLGGILYLFWFNSNKRAASVAGTGAVVGMIINGLFLMCGFFYLLSTPRMF